jgi:hypothetical protein
MRRIGLWVVAFAVVAIARAGVGTDAAPHKHKGPRITKVIGVVVDLGCAARGLAETGSFVHRANDHQTADGKTVVGCARACLERGQPAALLDPTHQRIVAIFACAPAPFARFAAETVEVQGYWAGKGGSTAFVPLKLKQRSASGPWTEIDCAEMH